MLAFVSRWRPFLFISFLTSVLAEGALGSSNCMPVSQPLNGHIVTRFDGQLLQFTCNPGYILIGSSTVVCQNGEWNSPMPTCRYAGKPIATSSPSTTAAHKAPQYSLLRRLSDRQYQEDYNLPTSDGWRSSRLLSQSKMPLFSWDSIPVSTPSNRITGSKSLALKHDDTARGRKASLVMSDSKNVNYDIDYVPHQYNNPETATQLQKKQRNRSASNRNFHNKNKRVLHSSTVVVDKPYTSMIKSLAGVMGSKVSDNTKPLYGSRTYDSLQTERLSSNKSNIGNSVPQWMVPSYKESSFSSNHFHPNISDSSSSLVTDDIVDTLANQNSSPLTDNNKELFSSFAEENTREISEVRANNLHDAISFIANNASLESTNFHMMNYTSIDLGQLDMSCLKSNDTIAHFISAPNVSNAMIDTYRRRHNTEKPFNTYLEAFYTCQDGYHLCDSLSHSLYCLDKKWVGLLPVCLPESSVSKDNQIGLGIEDEDPEIGNKPSCNVNKGGCHHVCEEGPKGDVICLCYKGYRLKENDVSCEDINECELNNTCQYQCWNVPGSYVCYCPDGYTLGSDRKTCLDKNECFLRNGHGPCQDMCTNNNGGYVCSCSIKGTQLSSDNHTCEDVDECADKNNGCSHSCLNTIGTAFCSCPEGFTLGDDWKTCQDVDECQFPEIAHSCREGCINTIGSFTCGQTTDKTEDNVKHNTEEITCSQGYVKSGHGECIDLDECSLDNFGCSHVCINREGSASCSCPPGFVLLEDWKTCEDVDECSSENVGCSQNCINTPGNVLCSCFNGYQLTEDGKTCEDINECESSSLKCSHDCVNTNGSAHCECPSGYQLNSGGFQCDDIDECRVANGGCEQTCVNTFGSYSCLCDVSHVLSRDAHSCSAEEETEVPYLECPPPVTVVLMVGRDKADVKLPIPNTNVDPGRLRLSPPWIHDFEGDFPAGLTVVTMETPPTSGEGYSATCSVQVTVLDKESPEVVNCPSPIYVTANKYNQRTPIVWEKPQFTDNVGVVYAWKNKEPGLFLPGVYTVKYIARDAAGNAAYCSFTIQITSDELSTVAGKPPI